MTRAARTRREPDDVQQAMRAFSAISESLLSSYEELGERAARVENELRRANEEIERKNERIHELDKMAALGTMAAGIAHEIRNPLNAIKGFAALLLREVTGDGRAAGAKTERWAARICEGVCEVDAIIESMLTFAEPERLRLEAIGSRSFIGDVLAALESGAPAELGGCEVTTEAEPFDFVGDRIKLRQALRNLVANAVEAQPAGGRVRVDLRRDAGEVVFHVTDAGPGIPASIRPRVTEPFFTTRAQGTGLGLSLVHTIARLHGGRLEISTEPAPQGGASVFLRIPLIPLS